MDPAISIEGLTKAYGDTVVLSGVDLDVERGTCCALLGPNGAGKTTTVEILEGYRRRDAGTVTVLGTDPETAGTAWRASIGIVLQESADNADLTCLEALRAFAVLYPTPRRPEEVLELVGLDAHGHDRARHLSGGQRRRLDVGLGIIGNPELLFLDEPTTGFDAEARRDFWRMIHSLKADGTTILLTTHYLEEAEELADDVAIIAGGRIVERGAPTSIGGRETATSLVRFRTPDGEVVEITTDDPARLIADLVAEHGRVDELAVTRPSLEDVYLDLIRRHHRADS
jgi:ABC-2 type transport system ATP-binding protein